MEFHGEKECLKNLEKMLNQLCKNREYVNRLTKKYEEVSITVYIRSDFAQIGYSLPNHILKKMSLLDCLFNFEIPSFGMAENPESPKSR